MFLCWFLAPLQENLILMQPVMLAFLDTCASLRERDAAAAWLCSQWNLFSWGTRLFKIMSAYLILGGRGWWWFCAGGSCLSGKSLIQNSFPTSLWNHQAVSACDIPIQNTSAWAVRGARFPVTRLLLGEGHENFSIHWQQVVWWLGIGFFWAEQNRKSV